MKLIPPFVSCTAALLSWAMADSTLSASPQTPQPLEAVDTRAIAIKKYNETNWQQVSGERRYLPPYDTQRHHIKVTPVDSKTISDLKLANADLSHTVCVTIWKARQQPALGGGTFYCIINTKTGDIIKSVRSR